MKDKSNDISLLKMYEDDMKQFDTSVLDEKQEKDLLTRYYNNQDKEAYEELILHNMKLVKYFARRYLSQGVEIVDLIQEGNIGLMEAIKHFDISKEVRFSTYATWWIRHFITRYIENRSKMIRIPVNLYIKLEEYKYYEELYMKTNCTVPFNEYIMSKLTISSNIYDSLTLNANEPLSLNVSVDDEDGRKTTVLDMVADSCDIENNYIQGLLLEDIDEVLNEKEKNILFMRYGITPYVRTYTCCEIGKLYGVSRQEISRIEIRAKRKLLLFYRNNGLSKKEATFKYVK